MAEFGESPSCIEDSTDMKQPIKKLEPAINRFTNIAIPLDLERLANHCRNIQKFQQLQQWDKLRVEQINARRTVQQLKANVREMEKVRLQVSDDDLKTFDSQVSPVKEEVIQAVVKVIELCGVENSPLDPPVMTQSLTESLLNTDENLRSRFRHANSLEASNYSSSMESSEAVPDAVPENLAQESTEAHDPLLHSQQHQQQQQQQQTEEVTMPSQEVQESWDMLKNELVELNSLTHEFAAQVQAQQEKVDSIQNNIEVAQSNIKTGVKHLLKASTYKAAMLPIGGALLGGIVGGPVGIVAGMKVGAAAALGGGVIGFVSGRAIKKRQEKKIQMEMEVLTNGTLEGSVTESRKDK